MDYQSYGILSDIFIIINSPSEIFISNNNMRSLTLFNKFRFAVNFHRISCFNEDLL